MRYGKNIISWLSWYIAETRYDPKYHWLWQINHDSLTKNAALYCFKPTQNFTSRCPNTCLSWTCTRRQARASLQPKNRLDFIHEKSIFQLGDISCYRQYFIDNRLTFKSNTAHHYFHSRLISLQNHSWFLPFYPWHVLEREHKLNKSSPTSWTVSLFINSDVWKKQIDLDFHILRKKLANGPQRHD